MNKGARFLFFITMQVILYLVFLSLDLTEENYMLSGRIKYAVVLLCLCYVLLPRRKKLAWDLLLLRAALIFTAISDLIILFMDEEYYFYGVLSFVIVQQLYGFRIMGRKVYERGICKRSGTIFSWLWFGIQAAGTLVIILIMYTMKLSMNRLLVVTVFYFISLVSNVCNGIKVAVENPVERSNLLFAVGICLFLLCDINVGLFNLSSYIQLSEKVSDAVYSLSSVLMWSFYAPSQVLIALSADHTAIMTKKYKKII